jgi:hypothetical protein
VWAALFDTGRAHASEARQPELPQPELRQRVPDPQPRARQRPRPASPSLHSAQPVPARATAGPPDSPAPPPFCRETRPSVTHLLGKQALRAQSSCTTRGPGAHRRGETTQVTTLSAACTSEARTPGRPPRRAHPPQDGPVVQGNPPLSHTFTGQTGLARPEFLHNTWF